MPSTQLSLKGWVGLHLLRCWLWNFYCYTTSLQRANECSYKFCSAHKVRLLLEKENFFKHLFALACIFLQMLNKSSDFSENNLLQSICGLQECSAGLQRETLYPHAPIYLQRPFDIPNEATCLCVTVDLWQKTAIRIIMRISTHQHQWIKG